MVCACLFNYSSSFYLFYIVGNLAPETRLFAVVKSFEVCEEFITFTSLFKVLVISELGWSDDVIRMNCCYLIILLFNCSCHFQYLNYVKWHQKLWQENDEKYSFQKVARLTDEDIGENQKTRTNSWTHDGKVIKHSKSNDANDEISAQL